jgi:hypothetical protein
MDLMLFAVLGWLAIASGAAAAQKVLPRDDVAKDRGLAEACRRIRQAAAARDARALLPVLAPEVNVDPTVSDRRVARADAPGVIAKWPEEKQRRFWRDVRDALQLGVVISDDGRHAYAPYVVAGRDIEVGDMAITGRGVRVRAAPSLTAPVVAVLSWIIVTPSYDSSPTDTIEIDGERYSWVEIKLPSGGVGFVPEKYIRYSTGPAVVFHKIDGHWQVVSFILDA